MSWILSLAFLSIFLFLPFRERGFEGRMIFGAMAFGVLLWSFLRINTLSIVHSDEEFLYINDFKKQYTVRYRDILKIWQSNDFFSRIINIKFKHSENQTKLIHFIGRFEMDYKGPHHPVITFIKNKIKPDLIETLYEQILFHSENGAKPIEHPSFLISETSKISSRPTKEVHQLYLSLFEIGFLEKVPEEEYAIVIKEKMAIGDIESLLRI